ncbi:MAG: Com family DNA-binding transcriptional regulator, partial [Candidatus Colwellbacteria bacterium]|nr:Com family DNA-binding transcriptional regulator [Candidatus Colwellbacteria bacterium]
ELFFKFAIFAGVLLIQLFFPKGTRTMSRRIFIENFNFLRDGLIVFPWFAGEVEKKYLREYRCPACHKLLAKGQLNHRDDLLEVKCRGCSTICLFQGEDAEIIEKRSIFLKQGLIPDPDKSKI